MDHCLLTKKKLQVLEQIVKEQLDVKDIEETTSYSNSVFVMKKKSGKWRMLSDLSIVKQIIQPMESLQSRISLPSLLPKDWPNTAIGL